MTKKSLLDPAFITPLINTMKVIFPTRDEVRTIVMEELDEKIKLLPTKDEFFTRMDKLSGELLAMRQEFTLHSGQHDEITDRFDRLDKHLGISTAA